MKRLELLAIGDCDRRILARLAAALGKLFHIRCVVAAKSIDPAPTFHPERQQYHSSEILLAMQSFVHGDSWRILGITMVDLYIPILTFVFGEAQMGGPCGLVSGHRLRQEFYGLPEDDELFERRLLTEAAHELGHTLQLTHCDDYQCAMAPSHGVEWMDLKLSSLCRACEARVFTSDSFDLKATCGSSSHTSSPPGTLYVSHDGTVTRLRHSARRSAISSERT